MAWTLELTNTAARQLAEPDKPVAQRIRKFLQQRIAPLENPRAPGQKLHGKLEEFWKYRVADYRIIARIEDDRLVVLIIQIGHRSEIYR